MNCLKMQNPDDAETGKLEYALCGLVIVFSISIYNSYSILLNP